MPGKYSRPIDLDDQVTEDLPVTETTTDETEPGEAETIETPFGLVTRRNQPGEQPRIQPANSGAPFEVGELHGAVLPERWALPPFQYPAPGEPLTAEIATAELHHSNLRARASRALNDLMIDYKLKVWNGGVEINNEIGVAERERLRRENRSFLEGVLKSHGLEVPTDEQIAEWAEEDLTHAASKQ